ncbi:hypothetical protein TNCV_2249191 [Trichonephila clavipes]|nr:hypothetical protein TNCV_2249191 [Trichonephila clavipes]
MDNPGHVYSMARDALNSVLPREERVTYFRVITEHHYFQAHLFKICLADSLLRPLCNPVPMTGEHLIGCPFLLHVRSQDNYGVLPHTSVTYVLYRTARRVDVAWCIF